MRLPKSIKFLLFKLKAYNFKYQTKEVIVVSLIGFWFLMVTISSIWFLVDKVLEDPFRILPMSSVREVMVKDPSTQAQIILIRDEALLKDLPKQVNSTKDLDSLITALKNSDLSQVNSGFLQ